MKIIFIVCISIIMLFPACMFYSFKGSLPAHIHSISLAPAMNESTEFSVAEILNNELNKLMMEENVLDIVTSDQADSQLKVVITSVTDRPHTVLFSDELGMEEVGVRKDLETHRTLKFEFGGTWSSAGLGGPQNVELGVLLDLEARRTLNLEFCWTWRPTGR